MRMFRDYLVEYSNNDTRPSIVALENMFAFYRGDNMKVHPFKSARSVFGISLKVSIIKAFNSIQDRDSFFIESTKRSPIWTTSSTVRS